jgi:hypothetical protein
LVGVFFVGSGCLMKSTINEGLEVGSFYFDLNIRRSQQVALSLVVLLKALFRLLFPIKLIKNCYA